MAKSLLSKLGKATATGLTALALATGIGTANKASAVPMNWGSSFSGIVPNNGDYPEYGGESINYNVNATFTNTANGQSMPSDLAWSLICVAYMPDYGGYGEVGGADGQGSSGSGYFNSVNPSSWLTGMQYGQTANTFDSSRYFVVIDGNKNGIFDVTYDPETGIYNPGLGDYVLSGANVIDFTPHGDSIPGSFSISGDYYEPVPEPTTVSLVGVGVVAAALAASRRRRGKGDSAK